tara:strand:- start:2710 stop:3723 length:1014 start_codon:yes stop_codon:yes gene_type:complete
VQNLQNIPQRSPSGRRTAHAVALVLLVVGIGIFLVMVRDVSLGDLCRVANQVDVGILAVAVVAGLAMTGLRTIRFYRFFPAPGRRLELYASFAMFRFLNFVLPFRSGEITFLALLSKFKFTGSIAGIAPVWILLRVTDLLALSLLFFCANSLVPLTQHFDVLQWGLIGLSTVLLAGVLMFSAWMVRANPTFSDTWLGRHARAAHAGFTRLDGWRPCLYSLFLGCLIWGTMAVLNTLMQMAFGSPLTVAQCAAVGVAAAAVSILPIHGPFAVGTSDVSWAGLMVLAGMPAGQAIATTLCVRLGLVSIILLDGTIGIVILWLCGCRQGKPDEPRLREPQ